MRKSIIMSMLDALSSEMTVRGGWRRIATVKLASACSHLLPIAFPWPCWTRPVTLASQLPNAGASHSQEAPQRQHIMQERWLSVEEIAAHLGVNRDTIYKWLVRKKMPAHKVGRLWKFLASEVDAWIKAGKAA